MSNKSVSWNLQNFLFQIVVSKLKSRTAMDHDRRHFKAAKALVIVIPLLGFTYLLTFIGPSKESNPLAYTIFQSVRAVLLSTQGAVITLPYCYLNSEVQGVIKTRWQRWKMVRNIEYALQCQSTRTSVATSTIYYAQVGQRERMINGHSPPLGIQLIVRFLMLSKQYNCNGITKLHTNWICDALIMPHTLAAGKYTGIFRSEQHVN